MATALPACRSPVWCFHDNHGSDVVLSNNRQTATHVTEVVANGVVMSEQPMEEMVMYEVLIDKAGDSGLHPFLGVLTESPDTVTPPLGAIDLMSAVVISPAWVSINGDMTWATQFPALFTVREKQSIGVMLDRQRHVHLIHNGQDQGVTTPEYRVPQSVNAFVLLDVRGRLKKVTTLPVRRV